MNKIIHYCWFGGKPLPKLAKKCIKSWEKYLPDYEIKRWDESNFDINVTNFSRDAYKAKKWAFVSDVARIYALKEYGGIYFDTDMLITKNIDFLLKDEFFAGWESSSHVAVGVLGVKSANNNIINSLWKKYKSISFSEEDMHSFAIPKVLTNILKNEYGLKIEKGDSQVLDNKIHIYSRDYFYPLSYDHKENMFTDNTCMIHYYDASWISKSERLLINVYRVLGKEKGDILMTNLRLVKKLLKRAIKIALFPLVFIVRRRRHLRHLRMKKTQLLSILGGKEGVKYLVIYNPDWLGIMYATNELFDNTFELEEIFSNTYTKDLAEIIADSRLKVLIFSGLALGWPNLAREVKKRNPDIKIKILWHGGHSMYVEKYDSHRFNDMFSLYQEGILSSLGFVKKSLAEFYKMKGYNSEFVMNTASISKEIKESVKEIENSSSEIRIGLYASGDRWVKNFYNQLAAVSLVKNAVVDCVPLSEKVNTFANIHNINILGEYKPLPRNTLLKRMAENDINLYVTYSECAPMLPLESFELGVPCITGNNHHYWMNSELKEYVVVNEVDDAIEIFNKIQYCLKNKEKVMRMYSEWKKKYDVEAHQNVQEILH